MIKLYKGEKRNLAIQVVSRSGEVFTISEATYEVVDEEFNSIDSGAALVSTDIISALIDTSLDDIEECKVYYVFFTATLTETGKVLKDKVEIKILKAA